MQTVQQIDQGLINHVGMVLDASLSMRLFTHDAVQIADRQVKELAKISTQMDQETRATVYTFSSPQDFRCVYYDKDVLRLQSLKGKYLVRGNTALIDATMQAIEDLEKTATLYGDHAFLLYVLTDGQENASVRYGARELRAKLERLPDNWTIAALVPNERSEREARLYGFLPGNIALWDTTAQGIYEAGATIHQATANFMQARAQGVRGSKNLFQATTAHVDQSQLKVLAPQTYTILLVEPDREGVSIKSYVEEKLQRPYQKGSAYYQLTKKEEIQPSKDILILDPSGKAFYGIEARRMVGIPEGIYANVAPENNPNYIIFVRSDSVNRKLVPNTMLIVRH